MVLWHRVRRACRFLFLRRGLDWRRKRHRGLLRLLGLHLFHDGAPLGRDKRQAEGRDHEYDRRAGRELGQEALRPPGPNTVWDAPPKAAPMSAPLPRCKSTMEIRMLETITWMVIRKNALLPPNPDKPGL